MLNRPEAYPRQVFPSIDGSRCILVAGQFVAGF
jgi:hypothetical protein